LKVCTKSGTSATAIALILGPYVYVSPYFTAARTQTFIRNLSAARKLSIVDSLQVSSSLEALSLSRLHKETSSVIGDLIVLVLVSVVAVGVAASTLFVLGPWSLLSSKVKQGMKK